MEYFILGSIRKLVHTIRTTFPQRISVSWLHGPPQKVQLGFLLSGPQKYYNGPVAELHGELCFLEQLLCRQLPPQITHLIHLYHDLLSCQWLVAAPVIKSDVAEPPEQIYWCFLETLIPDDTLLTDLLNATKQYVDDIQTYRKTIRLPPPAFRVDLLHEKLVRAGLPIVGCSAFNKEIHPTQGPATFHATEAGFVRLDWSSSPNPDQNAFAEQLFQKHAEFVKRRGKVEIPRSGERPSPNSLIAKARIYVEDIDSFQDAGKIRYADAAYLLTEDGRIELVEAEIKHGLGDILGVTVHQKDWGGEINDLYADVVFQGMRMPAAFLLKGTGLKHTKLEISGCGKNGDQLVRLLDSPAELFVVQFVGGISQNLIRDIEGKIELKRAQGKRAWYCILDGVDTARVLYIYGKLGRSRPNQPMKSRKALGKRR